MKMHEISFQKDAGNTVTFNSVFVFQSIAMGYIPQLTSKPGKILWKIDKLNCEGFLRKLSLVGSFHTESAGFRTTVLLTATSPWNFFMGNIQVFHSSYKNASKGCSWYIGTASIIWTLWK